MHDCPTCQVPLHGHEEVCPACGTKQYVRKQYRDFSKLPQEPGVNVIPFVVAVLIVGIIGIIAVQNSWIGQLVNKAPEKEDPLAKMTVMDARQIIETKISEGLTQAGAKGKFTWTTSGAPATKAAPQPVDLTIDTALSDPNQRRAILDPVKEYMEKARIPTLTMNDSKSHATWTYSVSIAPTTPNENQDPAPPMPLLPKD
jgi:hypothetical protein